MTPAVTVSLNPLASKASVTLGHESHDSMPSVKTLREYRSVGRQPTQSYPLVCDRVANPLVDPEGFNASWNGLLQSVRSLRTRIRRHR